MLLLGAFFSDSANGDDETLAHRDMGSLSELSADSLPILGFQR